MYSETKWVEVSLNDGNGQFDKSLKVKISFGYSTIEIQPRGYGEPEAEDGHGSPVFIELYNNELRVIASPDINDITKMQVISLEGARENRRKQGADHGK